VNRGLTTTVQFVAVHKEGFEFPPPGSLPEDIAALPSYPGGAYTHQHFDSSMSNLMRFIVSDDV
jgi:hypothetical protein